MHRSNISQEHSPALLLMRLNIEKQCSALVWCMCCMLGLISWLSPENRLYFAEVFHSEVR